MDALLAVKPYLITHKPQPSTRGGMAWAEYEVRLNGNGRNIEEQFIHKCYQNYYGNGGISITYKQQDMEFTEIPE